MNFEQTLKNLTRRRATKKSIFPFGFSRSQFETIRSEGKNRHRDTSVTSSAEGLNSVLFGNPASQTILHLALKGNGAPSSGMSLNRNQKLKFSEILKIKKKLQ